MLEDSVKYPVQHQFHPLHKAGLACSDEVRKQELMNSKSESSKRNNIICYSTVNKIQGFYRQACLSFR
jgi:hypothetical protein